MAGAHFSTMCGDCSFFGLVHSCTFKPGLSAVTVCGSKEMKNEENG